MIVAAGGRGILTVIRWPRAGYHVISIARCAVQDGRLWRAQQLRTMPLRSQSRIRAKIIAENTPRVSQVSAWLAAIRRSFAANCVPSVRQPHP